MKQNYHNDEFQSCESTKQRGKRFIIVSILSNFNNRSSLATKRQQVIITFCENKNLWYHDTKKVTIEIVLMI